MAKSPRKTDDALLPTGLSEEQLDRARFAQEFPPNTPHSVINHHYSLEHETKLAEIGDPRKLKTERVAGVEVVESAPGVTSSPVVESKARARKSRKTSKPTSKETAEKETAKV